MVRDNIKTFIDNFSAPNRIKFADNKLFIKSSGNRTIDFIVFGLSNLTLIIVFIAYSYYYGASIVYLILALVTLFLLFYFMSKGDNNISIDFLKKEITIRRRPQIFKLIPSRIISFDEINNFDTKEDITELDATFIKEYVIYLTKNNGLLRTVTLISFDPSERNNASQLLSFLKNTIFNRNSST